MGISILEPTLFFSFFALIMLDSILWTSVSLRLPAAVIPESSLPRSASYSSEFLSRTQFNEYEAQKNWRSANIWCLLFMAVTALSTFVSWPGFEMNIEVKSAIRNWILLCVLTGNSAYDIAKNFSDYFPSYQSIENTEERVLG